MFGPPREQKPAWKPPKWAVPILLILGLVWGYLEIRYAQSYFFGGAAIVLTALASYELYKYSPKASEESEIGDDGDPPDN